MTKINFSNLPEQQNNQAENKPKMLKPGIHEVTITGITESPDDMVGTSYVEIGFVDNNGSYLKPKSYTSEAAMKWTAIKLKNIATECDVQVPEEITVNALNAMLIGKKGFIKVNGEEVEIDDRNEAGKKVKVIRSSVEGFNFFKKDPSSLKFNELLDIKRLPLEDANMEQSGSISKGNDMPF